MQVFSIPFAERRIFLAVLIAIPLIATRLAYALLGEWSGDIEWNPYFGNTTIYLCMAVLEECLAVIALVGVGFFLPRLRTVRRDSSDDEDKSLRILAQYRPIRPLWRS